MQQVREVTFEGAGKYNVDPEKVKCSVEFEVTPNPGEGHLKFRSLETSGTFISNNSVSIGSNIFQSGNSSVTQIGGNGTTIRTTNNGASIKLGKNQYELTKDGPFTINGHRYRPYTFKKGPLKNKEIFMLENFAVIDDDEPIITIADSAIK